MYDMPVVPEKRLRQSLNVIKLRISKVPKLSFRNPFFAILRLKEVDRMPNQVRKQLRNSITAVIERDKRSLLHNPSDFTRKRELSLDKTVNLILGMSGKSISKELLDADIWITESAFVQARYKIKSSTFYKVFKEFTSKIPRHNPIPILAADGSDVNIPRNPKDKGTSFQAGEGNKSYNLIHLNAFYDLNTGIYTDVIVQDKRKADERQAVIDMMEVSPF